MGARPHLERAPKNNGGRPSSCGRFGDFLLFFMQLRVDDFQIRSRWYIGWYNINIFKMIGTHIETPVQAYIYRLIQLYINTHFSFQDTFCFCIICRLYTDTYIQADTYTYTLRYASTSIYVYADTVSHCVRHVTGNDQDYLRKIPRAVVQISALL